jgi:hypothetical protein
MKESIQKTKQLARTIQESSRNQKVGFVDNRSCPIIQMGKGGKRHHDPEKKSYLARGVGKRQKEVTKKQNEIRKSEGLGVTPQEAKREARKVVGKGR